MKLDWRRYVKPDEFIEVPFQCPECGGKMGVDIEEWDPGTGEITEGGFHLSCTEEELEPGDPNYWSHRYWQSDWQDVITDCYQWLQKHIRIAKAAR